MLTEREWTVQVLNKLISAKRIKRLVGAKREDRLLADGSCGTYTNSRTSSCGAYTNLDTSSSGGRRLDFKSLYSVRPESHGFLFVAPFSKAVVLG